SRPTAIPTAGEITVGVDHQRWSIAWNGAYGGNMDDLRIYNRLLSQDEITWLASATPLNDNQPPSAPTALQAVAVSQTESYLHWSSPTDNEFVAGYRVYRDNNLIGTTGETKYVDYGMTSGASHNYTVVAFDGASNNSNASMGVTVQAPNSGSVMDILPAGHWYEVQNSSIWTQLGVKPDVMGSWSGGVYDTNRERLVIWGGGHLNYDGNELYAFDFNTFNWMQLTKTTPKDQRVKSVKVYDDGMPTSVHTYDGLQYLPTLDKFFASGGSIWGSGGCSGGTWLYDFNAVPAESGWVDIANDKGGCGMYSAYDAATGNIWYGSFGNLYEFDPLNLSSPWTRRINDTAAESFYRTAAIDPNRRKMVVLGGLSGGSPETVIYDISNANAVTGGVVVTNGVNEEIEESNAAGFEFDPASDKFVAWSGGNQVYTLATDSLKWSRIEPASTSLITPSIPALRGTYGRFRYVPSKNVFVLVNDMQQNMFIYKLSAD
ncbi:MAG: fibronectin type III domain-containing protein, partial [Xanthomonadales bacterium]|nr:fibronectin type III domain-containing protein [Xanthomonadales bacterium]